nr:MerR family transcriptional regulator [uncultured Massilia sp.]
MNISEFARQVGMSPSAIRFYASKGFFVGKRAGNGYRTFDDKDVSDAEWIAIGKSFGVGLNELRLLIAEVNAPAPDGARIQALADTHLAQMDAQIRHLEQMRGRLLDKLASCPNKK